MQHIRKFVLGIVVVIGLLFIFFVTAGYFFNATSLKEKLTDQVYQLTGRTVVIRKETRWHLFPRLAIEARNVLVENSDKLNLKPLIRADSVRFYPELFPLFLGRLNVSEVRIQGLTLALDKENFYHSKAEVSGDVQLQGVLNIDREKKLFSFSGNLESTNLLISDLLFKNVHATIDIKNNVILLYPLTANLYEGNYQGQIFIDMGSTQPKITLNGNLAKANANLLFKSVMHKSQVPFSGLLSMTTALRFTPGKPKSQWNSLDGNLTLQVEKGVLHGVNIPALVELGQALVGQGKLPAFAHSNQTDFSDLQGSFQIHHGVLLNEDLMLRSEQLIATGHGRIDLVQEKVDYYLKAGFIAHKKVPIHIYGPFDDLNINTEALQINEKMLVSKVKHLEGKIKEKLHDLHIDTLFS
jgi:uncharacterized protein involved in outer membrane biogenesis